MRWHVLSRGMDKGLYHIAKIEDCEDGEEAIFQAYIRNREHFKAPGTTEMYCIPESMLTDQKYALIVSNKAAHVEVTAVVED